jgi:hypothetical protein
VSPDRLLSANSRQEARARTHDEVQSIRNSVEVVFEQVGLAIERHRCGRVPEHALHCLHVGAWH